MRRNHCTYIKTNIAHHYRGVVNEGSCRGVRDGAWLTISVSSSSSEFPSNSTDSNFKSFWFCTVDVASAENGMFPLFMEFCSVILLDLIFPIEAASKDVRSCWVLNSGLLPSVERWLDELGYSLVFPSSELTVDTAEWIDDIERLFLLRTGLLARLQF